MDCRISWRLSRRDRERLIELGAIVRRYSVWLNRHEYVDPTGAVAAWEDSTDDGTVLRESTDPVGIRQRKSVLQAA